MSPLAIVAAVGLAVGAGFLLEFVLSSAAEREWRALALGLGAGAPLVLAGVAAVTLQYPGKELAVWALLGIEALALAVLLLPTGRGEGTRIVGEPARVDERDAVFHRFYRLQPGTPDFEAYYEAHPEKRAFDDEIRAMPHLGFPGSKTHDPVVSPLFHTGFDVTEWLTEDVERAPEPMTGRRAALSPEDAARRLKGFALALGADAAGCTRLDPAWIYSHAARSAGPWGRTIDLDHGYAVAVATRMDHTLVRQAPRAPATTATALGYLQGAKVALSLARYLNLLGYRARAHVDGNYLVQVIPVAVDAGLGELGRHGLLIAPRLGSRLRLAVVTTDLPLAQDPRVDLGVQEFCRRCRKCAESCPSRSIDAGEKRDHNGVEKWQSEQDQCYRYWRRCGSDCGICIKVCPFSHPSSPSHDLVRHAIARNAVARRLALWADDLAYGRRPKRRYPWPDWHEPS